jgi:hypothetical protein
MTANWALSRPPEAVAIEIEKVKETGLTEAIGYIIDGGQEAKTEILDNMPALLNLPRSRICP